MAGSVDEMLPPPMAASNRARTLGGNRAFHNFYNDYSHIPDPNLRRRLALSEIDKVPFGLYHVRAVLVAGVGFLLDSYDIFAINLITTLLGMVFWSGDQDQDGYGGNGGVLPDTTNQALKASTSAGIVIGMIVFGWLADAVGRRRMYGIELAIIIFGTFSCALVSSGPAVSGCGLLIFWRVLMVSTDYRPHCIFGRVTDSMQGVGIGGDYPLSSVIASEFAPTRWRGAMIAAVFSMQGFGLLMSALVALVTTVAFKDSYIGIKDETMCDAACRVAADRSWRIIVGVGAIPACLALYYRITIPETPRYTFDVQHDVEKADADIRAYVQSKSTGEYEGNRNSRTRVSETLLNVPRASWADVFAYFREWKNLKVLIGTTTSWFFLDLAFYGLGLNSTIVLHAIGYASGSTLYDKLYNQAVGMIILACAGSIPGYWTAVLTIDTIGRKPLQVFGFLLLTIIFCILGFRLHSLSEGAMLALYIVGQFLFNAGPNTTTFVVPGECFPTRYRSTGHGLAAAMGKVGAIVAQGISIPLLKRESGSACVGNDCSPYLDRLLKLFALFMLLGTLVSLLIPETKGVTLEELSGESRTSYNAGCNGSISLASPKLRPWNPFHGGQPAGFFYPRTHTSSFAKGRRSPRMGIMASPELVAENARQQKSHFWRRSRKPRIGSGGLNEIALRSRSPGPNGNGDGGSEDGAASTTSQTMLHQQQLPTWGAGWGRIDRGGPAPTSENMQLQDVGSLLRQN
ncbi:Repressible high-affinity phosphate permease [Tolypocladium ophioglossoides CBS 100239]|uniref:Repressible high-affinity phosphate permease n=1 Tax=Tolypocladium ophioglossoides (strain CBS 100239) TaxID=1163406 RepID=A0A0L0NDI3_TOLOC|nr:Repressible high-affinity phosphate permease [Tolypocladium ophioglossoides CBS 100239]